MMLRAAICMSISVGGPHDTEEGLLWAPTTKNMGAAQLVAAIVLMSS